MRYLTFILIFLVLIAVIIGSVVIFKKDVSTNTHTQSYLIPQSITSKQIEWNGVPLIDSTNYNPSTNICTANRNGMNIIIEPCVAQDVDGQDIKQNVTFTWNGANPQNVGWIFVYDGEIESGSIKAWLNYSHSILGIRQINNWIDNYLVNGVQSYVNLSYIPESCDVGNLNNTQFYNVTLIGNSTTKTYCFTSRTAVNSTAFRISGNYYADESYNENIYYYDFKDVTSNIQFLGNGLLDDNRSYYRIESSTFQSGQSIPTNWVYTPKNKQRYGKWHILGYDADIGLVQSLTQNKYIYIDPWWSASWTKKKAIYINTTSILAIQNASVLINVSFDSDMQNDFDDLRWVDLEEDNELGYWFYNNSYLDSNSVTIYVKMNRNISSASNTTIYMYYGNPAASTTSSVANAFLFGDDFNSAIDWGNTWLSSNQSAYSASGGVLTALTTNNPIYTNISFNNGYEVIARAKISNANNNNGLYIHAVYSTNYQTIGSYNQQSRIYPGGEPSVVGGTINDNTYYIWKYKNNLSGSDTGNVTFENQTIILNHTAAGNIRTGQAGLKQGYAGVTATVDWFFVKRATHNEPTITFGIEESGINLEATQSSPANYFNTTDNTPNIVCNFTSTGQNITSVKLDVYDSSNNLDYTNTEGSLTTLSYNKTWTTSVLTDDDYNWSCFGYGNLGINASTSNRTLTIDTTAPTIVAYNITSISTVSLPVSSLWNQTITESHRDSCWYHTSDSATNVSFICTNVTLRTTTWNTYGLKYINIYANDTFGNLANKSYSLSISNISLTANSPADNYKSANPSVVFNCTAQFNPNSNSANVTLFIDSLANYSIQTNCGGSCAALSIQETRTLSEASHNWYCQAINKDNNDTATTVSRSITIDYTNPNVVIYNVTNTSGESIPPTKFWINGSDTNNESCWYHTSDSFTNTSISCSSTTATTINWATYGNKFVRAYANDTTGNKGTAITYLTVSNLSTSLITPANATWINTTNPTLSCLSENNPSAENNLSLYLDGVIQGTNTSSGTSIYETITATGLSQGTHTWYCIGGNTESGTTDTSETREFYVDSIFPSITITSPTGVINYQKPGLLLNLNWTTNDTNPTNCWYNYKGVNNTITCGLNTTTINTTSYDQRNVTFYANDSAANIYSAVTTWDYYFWESARYVPTNIYQTDIANYQLNGSSYNPTLLTATLWTGTSSSSTTRSYTGSNVSFTSSSSVPATAGSGTVAVFWSFGTFNTTSTNQTTNSILFGICNASLNASFLNITFYDESTNAKINATVDASTFEYRVALAGTESKNFTYANSTANYELDFCFSPADITIYNDINFRYSNTGYQRRTWNEHDVELTNTTTQKHLYLFSSASGQYVNFHTQNSLGIPISNVLVTVSNQILGFTESRYSDDEGVTSFWLNPSDEYTVVATKTGYVPTTRNVAPVDTDYDIVMQSEADATNITNVCAGLNITFYPNGTELANDTVYDFGANIVSSDITLTSWGFYVRNASEYIINQSSASGNGGLLTIESNTGQSPEVYLDVYVVYDGDTSTCARQIYYISNDVGKEYSINRFITDLRRYLDNGSIFGLTNFGLRIIIFVAMFVTLGILVTYFGTENSAIIILGYGIFSFVAYYVFGAAVMPIGVPVLLILGSISYMIWEWSR